MRKHIIWMGILLFACCVGAVLFVWSSGDEIPSIASPTVKLPEKEGEAAVATSGKPRLDPGKSREERIREMERLLEDANVPVEFWGKVIEENGRGLPKTVINYEIQRGKMNAAGNVVQDIIRESITTDTDGKFSITGSSGITLSIESVLKEGYRLGSHHQVVFAYSSSPEIYQANRVSPEVLTMVAEETEYKVSQGDFKLTVPWNGRVNRFDLDSGHQDPSGDLIVVVSRSSTARRFEWSITIEIDGGTLVEAEIGKGVIAPETGYKRTWRRSYPDETCLWLSGFDTDLFYRKDDHYGRLTLQIYATGPADGDGVRVFVNRYLNDTQGRRNTELTE